MEVEKILPLVPENGESLLVENIAHAENESYAIIALTIFLFGIHIMGTKFF